MLKQKSLSYFQNINRKQMFRLLLAMVLVYVAFWFLNYFTPEYADDYLYKFFYAKGKTKILVTNFFDIFYSQYHHYFQNNGRFPVHLMVQTFTGLWGKEVFNFFNAFIFVSFILILNKFMGKVTPINYIFVASLVLLLFPGVNLTLFWMTGSMNYMWVCLAIAIIIIFLPYLKTLKYKNIYLLLIIPGLFTGWGHEGICFPLALSFIIYLFTQRKTVCHTAAFPLISGFIIGAFICAFSPGIIKRSGVNTAFDFTERILRIIKILSELKIIFILLAYILLNFIKSPKKFKGWITYFYNKYSLYIWAIIFSFPILWASNIVVPRVGFGMEFYAFLILLGVIKDYNKPFMYIFKYLVISISIVFYSILISFSYENHKNTKELIAGLQKHESSVIIFNLTEIPQYLKNYIVRPLMQNCLSKESPTSKRLAILYGYDHLIFIPRQAYNAMVSDEVDPDFNNREKYYMDITKISESDIKKTAYRVYAKENRNDANLNLNEDDFIFEPISRPREFQIIKVNGQWWLLSTRKMYEGRYPIAIEMK